MAYQQFISPLKIVNRIVSNKSINGNYQMYHKNIHIQVLIAIND